MEAITGSYITAFLLGLFSTVHCLAMCGSVIGALTLSLPIEIRENQRKMLPYVFNYNLGRILSYAVAGAIVGLLSSPLANFGGHYVLRALSIVVMVAMGLYLAGWFPKFARMERLWCCSSALSRSAALTLCRPAGCVRKCCCWACRVDCLLITYWW